jgi:excisionase family DNA binding protein
MAMALMPSTTYIPDPEEASLAQASAQVLASKLVGRPERVAIRFVEGSREVIELPFAAVRLFIDLLNEMAEGNAVSLIPTHAELTTQQAADLINVSRSFLVKLLDEQEIPHRKVGTHRRVMFSDLQAYEERVRRDRSKVLDELVAESQALGLGYEQGI